MKENAKHKNKYIVYRHINGVSINGREYLLDDDGNIKEFESERKAKIFLRCFIPKKKIESICIELENDNNIQETDND